MPLRFLGWSVLTTDEQAGKRSTDLWLTTAVLRWHMPAFVMVHGRTT